MKKQISLLLIISVLLTGCSVPQVDNQSVTEPTEFTVTENIDYVPLNYEYQKATWLPYVEFTEYMQRKSKEEFSAAITELLEEQAIRGINTIYFHAHPEGDAYYKSDIYPNGTLNSGDYDPLQTVLDIAHSMNISVHAWINPYRMQTIEKMESLPDDFIVKQWINSGSPMVRQVGNRWYLNPAYDAVTNLICDTAQEIMENYDVDGIHIDDYFYPDTAPEFDIEAFEADGITDLANWRRDNITSMVQALYNTVKKHNNNLKFGISPQGNIDSDYNTQYADVELWTANQGYADYIVPQIYYGFANEVCPFMETLERWEALAADSGVSLVIGLAEYKIEKFDKWAGASGEKEFIEDPGTIDQQTCIVRDSEIADGYAFYR